MGEGFESVEKAAMRFLDEGTLVLTGADGKRVFLAALDVYGVDEHGVLVSHEGGGCTVVYPGRTVTPFRLAGDGFAPAVASALAALLNRIAEIE